MGADPTALKKASAKQGRHALVVLRLDFLAPDPSLAPFMPVAGTRKAFGDKQPGTKGPDALQLDSSPLAQLSADQLEQYRSALVERIRSHSCFARPPAAAGAAAGAAGAPAAGEAAGSLGTDAGVAGSGSVPEAVPGGGAQLQVSFSLPATALFWEGAAPPAKQGVWLQQAWSPVPLPPPSPQKTPKGRAAGS